MHLAELDLELLTVANYNDLRSLLLVNKHLSGLFNDFLWYRRIERLIGRPIEQLTMVPIRLAYCVIETFYNKAPERHVSYSCNWVIWRDDPVLFRLADSLLPPDSVDRVHLHIAALIHGPQSVKVLAQPNAGWFVDIVKTWKHGLDDTLYYEWFADYLESWKDTYGVTKALMEAWASGYEFLFRWLIDHGAHPVRAAYPFGCMDNDPLQERYFAFLARMERINHPATIHSLDKILARSFIHPHKSSFYPNLLISYGANPAYQDYRCYPADRDTIELFVAKVGVKCLTARSFRVFRNAVYRDDVELVRWLLDRYGQIIDINAADGYALRYAVREGNYDMVALLLNHRAQRVDISVKNYSVLLHASAKGRNEIVSLLLDYVKPNYHSVIVPLTIAVHLGNEELVRRFLNHPPSEQYLLDNNYLPKLIRTARRSGRMEIMRLLETIDGKRSEKLLT